MPSGLIHLTIAELYFQRDSQTDKRIVSLPDFLLGCIAPDAVNLGKMASQELRYAAHLRSRDIPVWLNNIHAYRAEKEAAFAERPDVLRGLLMHLYTDIAWDETVQPELFRRMGAAGIPRSEFSRRKWQEMAVLESQIRSWSNTEHALEELKKAGPCAVTTVTAEQVSAWQQETLRRYGTLTEKPGGLLDSSYLFAAFHRADELMTHEYS